MLWGAGTAAKCEFCLQLGAEAAFNYKEQDWAGHVRAAGPVDMVLDMVGAPYFQKNLSVLGDKGRCDC